MDYDKLRQAEVYVRGRSLSAETLAQWMDALGEFLAPLTEAAAREGREPVILDLGSGTGRFSVPLAEHFGAHVVGVEPSQKMRAEAARHSPHARVTYLTGSGEETPCDDASVDAALASQVMHHVRSVSETCRELRRVLRPGGLALVRSAFRDRIDEFAASAFFPAAREISQKLMPTVAAVTEEFEAAGFAVVARREVRQQLDPSLRAHYERMKLRAASTLEAISDEEFAGGLERLRRAAEVETEPKPVVETMDLVVFRKADMAARDA